MWRKSTHSGAENCAEVTEVGNFRKAAASNTDWTGNCAEVGNVRKSRYSNGTNCTEVGDYRSAGPCGECQCVEVASGVAVRDTKQAHLGPARDVLTFTPGQWATFLTSLKTEN